MHTGNDSDIIEFWLSLSIDRELAIDRDLSMVPTDNFESFVKTKIDDLVDIYEFPKSLTKQQRAIVHVMAEASNLRHFSDGELDNKFITIQRIIPNSNRSIISKTYCCM
jgi:hypothetical protein